MAVLERFAPTVSLTYSTATLPENATTPIFDMSSAAPTTILPRDEVFIMISYLKGPSGPINVLRPTGWDEWASTPGDVFVGGSQLAQIWHHRADNTSDDYPIIYASCTTASGDREIEAIATMWLYRGWKLGKAAAGTIGQASGIGPPTAPFSAECPERSVMISAAYQTRTSVTPNLATANGFDLMWAYDPPAGIRSSAYPPAIGIADKFVVEGEIDGPEWGNVSRGSSEGEHHAMWLVVTKIGGIVRGQHKIGGAHTHLIRGIHP